MAFKAEKSLRNCESSKRTRALGDYYSHQKLSTAKIFPHPVVGTLEPGGLVLGLTPDHPLKASALIGGASQTSWVSGGVWYYFSSLMGISIILGVDLLKTEAPLRL